MEDCWPCLGQGRTCVVLPMSLCAPVYAGTDSKQNVVIDTIMTKMERVPMIRAPQLESGFSIITQIFRCHSFSGISWWKKQSEEVIIHDMYLIGQNFRRTTFFGGQNFRHQVEILAVLSDEFWSDKVYAILQYLKGFTMDSYIYRRQWYYVKGSTKGFQ